MLSSKETWTTIIAPSLLIWCATAVALAQSPQAEARQALLESLEAHGGASAAARARRVILTGQVSVRSRTGMTERSFRIHGGEKGAARAEFTGQEYLRIYVTDGELARSSENGKVKGLKLRHTANKFFHFVPLTGIFAALTDNELQPLATVTEAGFLRIDVIHLDTRPRIPRKNSFQRLYEVRLDPESHLVSSVTMFSAWNEPEVPDEPQDIFEYSDYRLVEGLWVPFLEPRWLAKE